MLEETWFKLDADRGKVFHQWFIKYHIIKDTMLKPTREKAELGSPPLQFSQMRVNVLMSVSNRK